MRGSCHNLKNIDKDIIFIIGIIRNFNQIIFIKTLNKIAEKLKTDNVLVVDGAWGTMLQLAGLKSGECPELWNLDHPEEILSIARNYAELGVDILETNSFGGTGIKLKTYGLEDKVFAINRAAAELSFRASLQGQVVMGSMGPTGKILMMGEVTEEVVYQAFSEQSVALESGGAQAVIVETMTDIEEALLAIRAIQDHTGLEIIASFTFNHTAAGEYRTLMGQTPQQVISAVLDQGVEIVGTNCGFGLEKMIPLVREIHTLFPEVPILTNANAGIPIVKKGQVVYPDSPFDMARMIPVLMQAGARIIGGCCGTTPEHIKKVMEAIKTNPF